MKVEISVHGSTSSVFRLNFHNRPLDGACIVLVSRTKLFYHQEKYSYHQFTQNFLLSLPLF